MNQRHRAFVHYGAGGGVKVPFWQIWKAVGLCLILFPHCYKRVQNKIMEYTEQQLALSVQCCPLEEGGLKILCLHLTRISLVLLF